LRQDPWGEVRIHQIMLQDKRRTNCYKKAIENNLKTDSRVIDLGCGTGVLSFFAAVKGCRKVYAVDRSGIIDDAREAARKNNLQGRIEFIKADIRKFKPPAKTDMLIHDQLGVFIWNEDIVAKVARIRDNYLKKSAVIIPAKIEIYFVPVCYKSELERSVAFWSKKQYGIDFSNIGRKLFIQGHRQAVHPSVIFLKDTKLFLGKEKLVHRIDLTEDSRIPLKLAASFRLRKNAILSGVCIFLNIHFDRNTRLSTRPSRNNSHWGQLFLPCVEPEKILRDSVLDFTLFPDKKPEKWKFTFLIR